MKKLLLILIVPFLSFSQIEEGYYVSKYVGFAELDGGEYIIVEEEWTDATFYFTTEYFTLSFEGEEEDKIWYEYLGGLDDDDGDCPGWDIYEAEGGEVELWINYEEQEFWFWGALNSDDIFEELIYFEKIEPLD